MERNHNNIQLIIPILHYPPVIGGIEVFVENIARRLAASMDIQIITGKVYGTPRHETFHRLHIARVASLYALKNLSYSSYWYVLSALPILFWKTIRAVRHASRPLMHANGFFSGIVCMCVYFCTRVPYVITIQSADFSIYHPEARFFTRLQMAVERCVYRYAKVCHAVSNDLCTHYKNQGVQTCVMIPNGVEADIFKPLSDAEKDRVRKEYGVSSPAHVIVTTSRLEHKNGVQNLIAALQDIPDAYLIVAGDGSRRAELEVSAKTLGVEKRISFVGHVLHEKVGELVACADVYARTPLSEGFGIVFLEAMAAGVPVVATPVGGIPDFVTDGVTGLLAHPDDPHSIAHALTRILSDETLRKQLIANASKMVEEKYGWDVITNRIEKEVFKPAV